MSENEENVALNWVNLMGLEIGQEVLILPQAGQPGQGLQGELLELVVNQNGPLVVIIRQSAITPKVSVPWSSIMMITRPSAPKVPADKAPASDVSVADLIKMAEQMGVEVPSSIQELAEAEKVG